MKKNELKQLIQEKANQVPIPDVSVIVMRRYHEEAKTDPVIIPKKTFPVFYKWAYSLGLVLLIALTLYWVQPSQSLMAKEFENQQEDIIISTLSAMHVGFSVDLLLEQPATLIEQEIIHLQPYLVMMEILTTNQGLSLAREKNTQPSVMRQYRFETKNLENEKTDYAMAILSQKRRFGFRIFTGTIQIDQEAYPFTLILNTRREKTFSMTVDLSEDLQVKTRYHQEDGLKIYTNQLFESGQKVSSFAIRQMREPHQTVTDLVLTNDVRSAIYRFRQGNEGLTIAYAIRHNNQIESGEIGMMVQHNHMAGFVMDIRPNGAPAFVMDLKRLPNRVVPKPSNPHSPQ